MNRKEIAKDFANSLNHPEIEKIILFGSVARGEDIDESDIDMLIITKNDDESKINSDIYTKVFNILITTGQRISIKMRSKEYYNKYINSSFLSNVEKDGILLN
ncbi:nucleotidyltransferase domain-containing protein [Methanobrevibacter filiformis]|uniref:protein adenylyltransferase n=1 Tax=Methanobrevibacter filiformis TaxID=55758 RepID=A0A165YYX4_9EURY|nr:nucleotidyltransferase domain-containing protein [Methanobrevibacter filiformis]KZX10046.1 nucleotidyltransferase domain protein [Methanobrevibacter filiformis]